ncbi:hypothetical protein KO481_22785 [Nocardia sp. NEAU-G5]|uniref:YCII-related domain-containing protein n=1 Tax=Nocardia albiluteola TaxID=2842303 RepID=A0ABS6B222_9NOCA|nr:hypothetical protein [Nocardia albiluteola]MBU3064347.1 hypothetical protein [Nocardia albiluteola]
MVLAVSDGVVEQRPQLLDHQLCRAEPLVQSGLADDERELNRHSSGVVTVHGSTPNSTGSSEPEFVVSACWIDPRAGVDAAGDWFSVEIEPVVLA